MIFPLAPLFILLSACGFATSTKVSRTTNAERLAQRLAPLPPKRLFDPTAPHLAKRSAGPCNGNAIYCFETGSAGSLFGGDALIESLLSQYGLTDATTAGLYCTSDDEIQGSTELCCEVYEGNFGLGCYNL